MDDKLKALSDASIQKFQKNQFDEAAKGFRACIAELEKTNDLLDLAEMRNNLCVTLLRQGDAQGALDSVIGTDEVFSAAGDQKRQGIALANYGNALESLKRFEEAIPAYEKARDCFKACGEKKLLSITLRSLSDLQLKTGKQFQAVATLQDAYQQDPNKKTKNKVFSNILNRTIKKITGK